ncbi:MAG: hypothetical protein K5769_11080 [Pseudobutyrivibrio sp.]|nr:hypothetical protein [Pseudobutyrivibrio sp.]
MNLLKRVMAFLLCLLLFTSTMGDDILSSASEETTVVETTASSEGVAEPAQVQADVAPEPAPAEPVVEQPATASETTDVAPEAPEVAESQPSSDNQDVNIENPVTTPEEVANSDAKDETPNEENKEDIEKQQDVEKDTEAEEELTQEESEEEDEEELEEEEEDEEEEEECEHKNYTYKSNHDGTHKVYCADCGEYLKDESCKYDKAGKCIHCGYEYIINTEISVRCDGLNFNIKGRMPRDAYAEIKAVDIASVDDILEDNGKDDFTAFKAYDITIKDGSGNVYQPEDHGYSLSITVKGIEEVKRADDEDVSVLRVEHDNSTLTELKSDVNNDTVTFKSEHFSVIIIGAKDSEIVDEDYVSVESDQTLSITGQLSSITKNYGRVKSLTIYVYLDAGDTFECTGEIRKGLTNLNSPLTGTVVGTCNDTKSVTESGWYPVTIEFDEEDNAWLAKDSIYSVTLRDFADTVRIQKGTQKIFIDGEDEGSDTYIKASVAIEEKDQPYAISKITLSSKNGKTVTSSKEIYYAKGESDTLVVTAEDSSGKKYDVNVAWDTNVTSGTAPIQLADDGKISANNPGRVKVTASFGAITSDEYTIIVYDIKLDGRTTAFSAQYTGRAIEPTVTLNDGDTDISKGTSTFSTSYRNNTDVGQATVTINGAGDIYSFEKNFTITKRDLNDFDFAAAKYTIDTATDTVANVEDIATKDTVTEEVNAPEINTDFTIEVTRKGVAAEGIVYEATISAMGSNYKGSVTLENLVYTAENLQLADYLDITWKSTPNKTYNAQPITFSKSDFNITDKAGNAVEIDLDISYRDNTAGNDEHLGTVIFKDGSATPIYQGEIELQFYIAPANIEVGEFTATWENGVSTFTHTGSAVEPGDKLTLTYKSSDMSAAETLVENTDYTLTYSNNINTGKNTALITINGIGNYTGTQTVNFSIEGALGNDAIVYLNGTYKATKDKASEQGDWVSGLSKNYDGTVQKPDSIRVYLPGKGDLPTTDYSVAYADSMDGAASLTAKAGTKYVIITGADKYNNEKITVSYVVSPISINSSKVKFELTASGKAKTYGKEDDPGEPINLLAEDYTLKFNNAALSTDDYTIQCSNNVDATNTAKYTITGKGNFTGTRTGYYTIAAATLTAEMVRFKDGEPLSIKYNGMAQEPEVSVSLRNADMAGNYDVTYTDNIAKGTAKATIVPKNNLTGDAIVKEFTITSKSLSTLTITLSNYEITPVSSGVYFCEGYAPTYTGMSLAPTVAVKDNGTTLKRGTGEGCSYTTTFNNKVKVSDYETHRQAGTLSQAANVVIKGQNNYAGEMIVVYYNIVQRQLNESTTKVTAKDGVSPISITWAENTVNIPQASDMKVTYNGSELTYGTDFEITVEDEDQAKVAGASVAARVVGKGNYTGSVAFTYEIGKSMDDANTVIQLINPLSDSAYSATNKDAAGNYIVTWLPGNNKPDVRVVVNGTALTKDADYSLTYTGTLGDDYNSYDGENIVTIQIKGKGGYYGTKTLGYRIMPINLASTTPNWGTYDAEIPAGLSVREKKNFTYEYTGATIDVRNNLEVHYKVGSEDYVLNSTATTDYTFVDDKTTIGPKSSITGITYHLEIEGRGNFVGKLTVPDATTTYLINQIDLSGLQVVAPTAESSMPNNSVQIVDSEHNSSSPIRYSASDYTSTNGYYAIYTGEPIKFDDYIVVKDTNGNILTKGTDYILRYTEAGSTTPTNKNVGEAKVFIEGVAGSNYRGTKEVKFTIISISVGTLSASFAGSYTYNKEVQMPEDVVVTDGSRVLQRHTDYDIYGIDIPEADSPADFRGNNREPGANKSNYITICGKGQYSGDLKVYFDIDLDIGASDFTSTVDEENNKYVLNNDYARIEISNICDYDELPSVSIKYKKQNGDLVTVNPNTTGSSTSEKNYEVSRETIVPGPGSATITGYNNGTYNCVKGSRTISNISFQADMSKDTYSEGYIANYAYLDKGDYPFTAEHICPEVHVAYGREGVDYELDYNEGEANPSSADNYFVRVSAKAGSKYFRENTSIQLTYVTKYDLDASVTKIELSGAGITWDATNNVYKASYTGSPINYSVKVSAGGYTISTGSGNGIFVITSDDGMTDVGLHLVTVERNPNNAQMMGGPRMIPIEITGKSINAEDGGELTLATPQASQGTSAGWYYTREAIRPTPTVKLTAAGETTTLREGRDYAISYVNNYNVGTATATVTGIGAYSGTLVKEFNIIPRSFSSAGFDVIVGDAHYVGPGVPVKPDVQVTYNGMVLIKDEDYTYSYDQNTLGATNTASANPVYGLINIEGRGCYSGDLQKSFTIEQLDLAKTTVYVEDDSTVGEYTGKVITPRLSVKVRDYDGNEQTLVECSKDASGNYVSPSDGDYEITIYNGSGQASQIKNMGTYQVDIGGTLNCKNRKRIEYRVTKRSIAKNWAQPGNDDKADKDITITVSDVETFDGPAVPSSITITDAGVLNEAGNGPKVLREGVDYTVSYGNNSTGAKGEYTTEKDANGNFIPAEDSPYALITGIGNYNDDSLKVAYNIGLNLEQMLEDDILEVITTLGNEAVEGKYVYDGQKHSPAYKLKLSDGTVLTQGEDYTLELKDANGIDDRIHAGVRTVTIKGTGKYYGKIVRTYEIVKRQVLGSIDYTNQYNPADPEFTFEISNPNMRMLDEDDDNLYGEEYRDYYFQPYAGKAVKPTIKLYDSGLATDSKLVDPSEYTVEYGNNNAAFDPRETSPSAFAYAKITFKDDSNYDGSSKAFTCYFIIGPDDIEDSSFTVRFASELENQTNFVFPYTGEEVHPEMLVTDTVSGTVLQKGRDYNVYYAKGNTELSDISEIKAAARATATKTITPGSNYVYVEGRGSYSGIRARNYAIVADLSDTNLVKIVTYDAQGNEINGIKKQFLTGREIVPEFDVRLYQADGVTYSTLVKDRDYKVSVRSDDWNTRGEATINAYSEYLTGSQTATFSVALDPDMINIVDDNNFEYTFNGYDIKPVFKTDVSTIEVDNITYKRLTGDGGANNFTNVGTIEATITLKMASTGEIVKDHNDRPKTWKVTYEIQQLLMSDPSVKINNIDARRYTGSPIKPKNLSVYIKSVNPVTGDKQEYDLTQGTDYSITYGKQVVNSGTVRFDGLTTNIGGTTTKTFKIYVGKPENLFISETTNSSLTVRWQNDVYAEKAYLKINEIDDSGNDIEGSQKFVEVTINNDNTKNISADPKSPQYRTDYTFKNLKNSTAYRITIQSKAVYNTSAQLSGESKIVGKTTTGRLSDSDVVVELEKSGNKVKVSWPEPAAGDEKYYHIYVGDNNSKNLELKAIIPASTAGYTNSGLTKGHTYYYYIVECKVVGVNHVPLRESKIKAITIN